MIYKDWKIIYKKISKDLDFREEKDKSASEILNQLISKKILLSLKELKKIITGKEVVIFGAGPSLESSLKIHKEKIAKMIKISADGATSALINNNVQPDIIVTDLDGKISDQFNANSGGSIAIIHAHGDNIDHLKQYVPKFEGKIIGTTQINSGFYNNLNNFGGFTDGDRAIFLVDHFHAKKINLIGFDFDGKIGKFSFQEYKNKNQKLKKLKWCEYLVDLLKKDNPNIQEL
jgi:uncharacterized Rossmann fold enzyme